MARVKLDVTNYIDWGTGEMPQETLDLFTEGTSVTYDLEDGWTNDFGNTLLEFVGTRSDLVKVITRWSPDDCEESEEERQIAIDDIDDEKSLSKDEALVALLAAVRDWYDNRIFIADECDAKEFDLGFACDEYARVLRENGETW